MIVRPLMKLIICCNSTSLRFMRVNRLYNVPIVTRSYVRIVLRYICGHVRVKEVNVTQCTSAHSLIVKKIFILLQSVIDITSISMRIFIKSYHFQTF